MAREAAVDTADPEGALGNLLASAAGLPGVRIDRDSYLRKALARDCNDEQIALAISADPKTAGIDPKVLRKLAKDSIAWESTRVTALSTAAGIPGGLLMIGTVPADIAQYFAHVLRVAQKLAYLYSWPDLFDGEGDGMDDATKNVLILFLGVMSGVGSANIAVSKVAGLMAQQAAKELPKKALTKGVVYPLVKKVSTKVLGQQMTKGMFAGGVAKAIPVVGGVVSGGLTYATFRPMCKRLRQHLEGLEFPEQKKSKDGDLATETSDRP
ncbi:hypothetical protein [Brachybacterium huguangmaarense]